jgi:L-ascorbate metabolism protein UlaG (beta-lactamase superfamily)
MELTYYGGGCVQIALKKLKILVDPLTGAYGPDPKTKADVVLYTQQPDHPASASAGVTIDSPGEYEMKNVSIEGVAARLHTEEDESKQDGVSFIISSGGSRVLVTGNIHPELSESQIEQLDGVDVMVVPVGGNGLTLDKDGAASVVRQFTPDAVVPVHYDDGVTDYPMPQTGVDEFLGEMGASDREPQNSMKVSGRDSNEEVQVVQLAIQK